MAGTAAARALSTRFAVATRADDAALRRLLRENPMRGAVRVSFEREPGYFRGADLAGGVDQTIIAHESARLVCMGRCTERACWVDGHETRVGYLAELRLDALARGRFGILRDGYEFFGELQRDDPAAVYFTSIAADNERARRLLESGVRGLPTYAFLAEMDTLLVAVPGRVRTSRLRVECATPERVPDLLRVLNAHGRVTNSPRCGRRRISPRWLRTACHWSVSFSRSTAMRSLRVAHCGISAGFGRP